MTISGKISSFGITSRTEKDTFALGAALGRCLKENDIVAISGPLGAGKTALIKGAAAGLDAKGPAVSPTFTLINEYSGRLDIYHFDFYRIKNIDELENIGCYEYFSKGGVCLIEWADKFPGIFHGRNFIITINKIPGGAREIRIKGKARRIGELKEALKNC